MTRIGFINTGPGEPIPQKTLTGIYFEFSLAEFCSLPVSPWLCSLRCVKLEVEEISPNKITCEIEHVVTWGLKNNEIVRLPRSSFETVAKCYYKV